MLSFFDDLNISSFNTDKCTSRSLYFNYWNIIFHNISVNFYCINTNKMVTVLDVVQWHMAHDLIKHEWWHSGVRQYSNFTTIAQWWPFDHLTPASDKSAVWLYWCNSLKLINFLTKQWKLHITSEHTTVKILKGSNTKYKQHS